MAQGAVPINKYVAAYGGELHGRVLTERESQTGIDAFRNKTLRKALASQRKRLSGSLSVEGLIKEFGEEKAFSHLYVLEAEEIDADTLQAYLAQQMHDAHGNHDAMVALLMNKPEMRRAIRIYDYVRYGKR